MSCCHPMGILLIAFHSNFHLFFKFEVHTSFIINIFIKDLTVLQCCYFMINILERVWWPSGNLRCLPLNPGVVCSSATLGHNLYIYLILFTAK